MSSGTRLGTAPSGDIFVAGGEASHDCSLWGYASKARSLRWSALRLLELENMLLPPRGRVSRLLPPAMPRSLRRATYDASFGETLRCGEGTRLWTALSGGGTLRGVPLVPKGRVAALLSSIVPLKGCCPRDASVDCSLRRHARSRGIGTVPLDGVFPRVHTSIAQGMRSRTALFGEMSHDVLSSRLCWHRRTCVSRHVRWSLRSEQCMVQMVTRFSHTTRTVSLAPPLNSAPSES